MGCGSNCGLRKASARGSHHGARKSPIASAFLALVWNGAFRPTFERLPYETRSGDALVGLTRAAPALQARPSMAAPLIAATLLSVDRVFKTDGLRRALCAAAIHPFGASTVAWPIISETPSQTVAIRSRFVVPGVPNGMP